MNDFINTWWPILAFLTVQTVVITWWAATISQRVVTLEKDSEAHKNHGSDIVLLKSSIEHLTDKVGELIDEIRATPARARR